MNLEQAVHAMPWYDTHSHMACNEAIGLSGGTEGAFLCDCVRGLDLPEMDLWALLTSPYMKWMLATIGENIDAAARRAGYASALAWARARPEAWWAGHWRLYHRLAGTGVSKALARGIRELHAVDLRYDERAPVMALNEKILAAYREHGFYGWWRQAFARLRCVRSVKLVEMPYYDSPPADEASWTRERELVTTALRVDTFTAHKIPREWMGFRLRPEAIGIQADSIEDYLAQVEQALDRARAAGMRALKNAVAYSGPLKLPPRDPAAAGRFLTTGAMDDYRPFEGEVLRTLLAWCDRHALPYQMHAGVANIPWCNCELLADQFLAYPRVRFTLLHVYPYLREGGCLARLNANVYLDPCWLSILSPETLKAALREWIGMVPPEKMLFGVDATNVEEWYGGAIAAKETLIQVLEEKVRGGALGEDEALDCAREMLGGTAARWYGPTI